MTQLRGGRPQWRLLPVAAAAWATAAGATFLAPHQALEVAGAGAVVAMFARHRSRLLAAAAIGVVLAGLSTAWHVQRLRVGPVPALARQHAEVDLFARLVRDPIAAGAGLTITDATATSVWTGRWEPVSSPLLVLSYGAGWNGLLPGQLVEVTGRLTPPRRGDDVAAVLEARAPPVLRGRPPWWQRFAGGIRHRLRQACAGLPGDERGLLPSLVDGDTAAVPQGLQGDMRISGLTHLEAVSGENVTVVIGVTLALARSVGLRRRGRAVVGAVALLSFVVLARPSPSVLRAGVMGAIALLAMLAGRRRSALPALSAAVLVLVAVDPFLGRSVGFVLSVVATGALILIAPGWANRLERHLPRWLAVAVAIPAAAQLACTPVLILVFGRLTPYAVLANLLAAPAVVPATILGVLTAGIAEIVPSLARVTAVLGAVPVWWIAAVARGTAGLPGAGLRTTAGVTAIVIGLIVGPAVWFGARAALRKPASDVSP